MADKSRCCRCAHYTQKQPPQGTCDVTKESTLAWWGCENDFVLASHPAWWKEQK